MNRLFEEKIDVLRIDLSRKVMKTSFETIERKATKIAPILTAEVNTLTSFVKLLPEAIISSLKIFGILMYMLWLSWQISLFIALLLGVILAINFSVLGRVHREERKAKDVGKIYVEVAVAVEISKRNANIISRVSDPELALGDRVPHWH